MCVCILSLANTSEVQWKVTDAEKERGSQPNYNGCIITATVLQMPFAGHLLLLHEMCGFSHILWCLYGGKNVPGQTVRPDISFTLRSFTQSRRTLNEAFVWETPVLHADMWVTADFLFKITFIERRCNKIE